MKDATHDVAAILPPLATITIVIPAKAGTPGAVKRAFESVWAPAFAGVTIAGGMEGLSTAAAIGGRR